MDEFLSMALIPLMMAGSMGYYAFRMLVLHDETCFRPNDGRKYKDSAGYTREGGKLLAFLSVSSLIMLGLMFVNAYLAFGQICICCIIFGILWKRMHEKYS